jgi:hypothetical protein
VLARGRKFGFIIVKRPKNKSSNEKNVVEVKKKFIAFVYQKLLLLIFRCYRLILSQVYLM